MNNNIAKKPKTVTTSHHSSNGCLWFQWQNLRKFGSIKKVVFIFLLQWFQRNHSNFPFKLENFREFFHRIFSFFSFFVLIGIFQWRRIKMYFVVCALRALFAMINDYHFHRVCECDFHWFYKHYNISSGTNEQFLGEQQNVMHGFILLRKAKKKKKMEFPPENCRVFNDTRIQILATSSFTSNIFLILCQWCSNFDNVKMRIELNLVTLMTFIDMCKRSHFIYDFRCRSINGSSMHNWISNEIDRI